ncbi:MAG: YbgC/FadM family acyl-CoA thioesterase [Burkholderiales bacterium]|jgi:acyl-CoA thioester hydrolase|nr:YbgC/FadM family acyl-CoA thioesterase [Burkholderiales bacterium]TBR76118.1 MAG: YbgC/FadM family acyl-CoA thioesterase [Burkholderiaceae bacterium]
MQPAFHWPVRVYWEDTDAGGIVFYANYLKFFERARTEWLRSLGLSQRALRDASGGMFVVADSHVKYHRAARLDDLLVVTAQLKEVGQASMTILQQTLLKSEQISTLPAELLCDGSIRIGWVDGATLKPAKIPKNILEALQ